MTKDEPPVAPRVRIRRRFDAPPAEVFAAWTDADGMRHWMRPGSMTDAECELDVREGGTFRIAMIGPDGDRADHRGEYRTIEPPHRLKASPGGAPRPGADAGAPAADAGEARGADAIGRATEGER